MPLIFFLNNNEKERTRNLSFKPFNLFIDFRAACDKVEGSPTAYPETL